MPEFIIFFFKEFNLTLDWKLSGLLTSTFHDNTLFWWEIIDPWKTDNILRRIHKLFWYSFLLLPFIPWFSLDFMEQIKTPHFEISMFKNGYLFFLPNFVEIVHIKLPNKWWKFAMLEELGQYFSRKPLFILDNETVTLVCPLHNVTVSLILNNHKDTSKILYVFIMKLDISSFRWVLFLFKFG